MRKLVDRAVPLVCGLCAAIACGVLILIAAAILFRGLPAITWNFLTEQIRLVGAAGGIFYNLVGTLILIATALFTAGPIAIALSLFHSVYLKAHPLRRYVTLFLYTLNGVPSILFGIFGLLVFVNFLGLGKSWLNGGIVLGAMILPTVAIALIERIESVPASYIEAAAGLGLSRSQTIWSVIIPQSFSGLLTGSLLGLARAAGETAPIMFTATIFAGATVPHGLRQSPVLSLPYHIFILAQDSFDPSTGTKLWGAALVLLALAFGLSLIALPARLRIHEEANY